MGPDRSPTGPQKESQPRRKEHAMPELQLDTGLKGKQKTSSLPSLDDFFGTAPVLTSKGKDEAPARTRDSNLPKHDGNKGRNEKADGDGKKKKRPRDMSDEEEEEPVGDVLKKSQQVSSKAAESKQEGGDKKKKKKEDRAEKQQISDALKQAKQIASKAGAGDEEAGAKKKKKKKEEGNNTVQPTADGGKEPGAAEGGDEAAGDESESDDDDSEDKSERTIFVGSIPHKMTKKQLRSLFKECGEIESVRMRSIPIESPGLSKKASIAMGKISTVRETCNAYVVFSDASYAKNALKMNGQQVRGHHIRVDMAEGGNKNFNARLSIFVGNLTFNVEEEAVRRYFAQCGKVLGVRLIRDKETSMGKGFGYVAFSDVDAVQAAVKMHGKKFQGRELRVFRAAKRDKAAKMEQQRKDRAAAKGSVKKSPKQGAHSPHIPIFASKRTPDADGKASGAARRLLSKEGGGERVLKHQGFKANPKSVPKFKPSSKGSKGKLGKKKTKTAERKKKQAKVTKKIQKMAKKAKAQK